jgi:hypothetical protein
MKQAKVGIVSFGQGSFEERTLVEASDWMA